MSGSDCVLTLVPVSVDRLSSGDNDSLETLEWSEWSLDVSQMDMEWRCSIGPLATLRYLKLMGKGCI